MSTVANLVDRIYREALARPDEEPTQTTIVGSMTDVATSVTFAAMAMPEEEELFGVGSTVEVGTELMRVTALNPATKVITVKRGVRGTTAAAHDAGSSLYLAPPYGRQAVFDTVADSIVDLYPDLYRVITEDVDPVPLSQISDLNAETVLSVRSLVGDEWIETMAEFVPGLEGEVAANSLAIALPAECWNRDTYVTYRASFPRPATEADTLASLGVPETYQRLIMLDSLAYLVSVLGPDAIRSEFVTEALEEAGQTPGIEQSLAVSLIRLRQTYLSRHKKALAKQYRPRIRMRAAY